MCLAVPGKVLNIEGDDPLTLNGKVDFAGVVKQVNLAYVPEAKTGDYVLVHAGFAISVIDAEQAGLVLECLRKMDANDDPAESGLK
jgi:hydrogenase expression/formation protein HypC